jgi:hypothetical protein
MFVVFFKSSSSPIKSVCEIIWNSTLLGQPQAQDLIKI